jgi:uncharacterized DUF497 family protein
VLAHATMHRTVSRSCPSVEMSLNYCSYPGILDTSGFWGYKNIVSIAFDPDKDARNIATHGIPLARAGEMDMSAALIREDDRFDYGETRYVAFGDIDDALHCLVFTFRGSKVRAISLRQANKKERRRYGRQTEV